MSGKVGLSGMNKLKASKQASGFPGVKQQEEANMKAEVAKTIAREDRAALKAARREEDTAKKALLEREKENYTKIYVLKCYNGWLKICDNSAMMVAKWLDGRLGRSYDISDDGGYGVRASYGIVSIPPASVGDFIERMARGGIPLTFDDAWILEFNLGERVSQEEMVRMLHEDELIIEKANRMVMPKALFPELRADIKTLLNFIHVQTRNQRESTKEVLMNDAEKCAINANKLVIATARGQVQIGDCLDKIGVFTEEMYGNVTTMSNMGLITAKRYKQCVDMIARIEADRAREMKRILIAKTKSRVSKLKNKGTNDEEVTTASGRRVGSVQPTLTDFE